MSGLDQQIGGNHYKKFAVQPIEFTTENSYDPSAHNVVKYVLRHPDKGGIQDLRKAGHFALIRMELFASSDRRYRFYNTIRQYEPKISVNYFCAINEIPALETHALLALDRWVWNAHKSPMIYQEGYHGLLDAINAVARARYEEMV